MMVKRQQKRRDSAGRLFSVLFASVAAVTMLLSGVTQPVAAVTSVPLKMNFQGRLTNSSGNILANGTYNMKLRLYSSASGGSAVWSEDRLVSASTGVTVTNGLFSIRLGDVTSLPASLFDNQTYSSLYLETELPTPATATSSSPSWTEGAMTPRNQMATSAYAYNSDTLDGLDSSAFAQVGGSNTFTGANTFRNSTNSTSGFSIQDSSGASLLTADTTNSRLYIGNPTADANTTFLAVDSYNGGASDPSGGFNGAIYYNTTNGKLRCYEGGAWKDCISGSSSETTVKIVSDVANASATANTLADTGLQFAVSAGVTYRFTTFITYTSAATTTGSRWTVTGPAAGVATRAIYTLTATSATTAYASAYNMPTASNASSLTAGNIAVVEGRITPTASGTVKIQFASEIANSAITAKAGSSLTYWVE